MSDPKSIDFSVMFKNVHEYKTIKPLGLLTLFFEKLIKCLNLSVS